MFYSYKIKIKKNRKKINSTAMATARRPFLSSPTYIFLSLQLSINIRFGKSNVNYQFFRTVLKVLWNSQSGIKIW